MFSLDLQELGQFGDILGRRPESSSSDDHTWRPLTNLSLG